MKISQVVLTHNTILVERNTYTIVLRRTNENFVLSVNNVPTDEQVGTSITIEQTDSSISNCVVSYGYISPTNGILAYNRTLSDAETQQIYNTLGGKEHGI